MTEDESTSPLLFLKPSSTSTSNTDPSPELFKRPQVNMKESDSEVEASDEEETYKDHEEDDDVEIPNANNSYEEERKRNTERNKMLLANLGLEKGLLPKSESETTQNFSSTKKRKSLEVTETRRSSRLSTKPKQTYNYSKIEKEQQRLRKEQERLIREEKLRQKEEEKKRKKYYSRRNKDDSDDDSDSNFVTTSFYGGNGQRRSGRLKNKEKIDYANLEKKYAEVDIDTEDNISYTSTKTQKKKKRKTSSSSDDIFSECENVVVTFSSVKNLKELTEMVTVLKGQVKMDIKDLSQVTHIVCEEYKRTLKTMAGIIRGCYIVTSEWLRASERKNGFLNEKDYVPSCEHDLVEAQQRALEKPIFQNLNFYIAPETNNAEIQYQLIELGEGNVIDLDTLKSKVEGGEDLDTLIVIGDNPKLDELKEELKKLKLPDTAFQTPEFIYASAVTQKLVWDGQEEEEE